MRTDQPARGPGALLARQRQQIIAREVADRGGIKIADLVQLLGVSDMTVRRDLQDLADRGIVRKVHGGALPGLGTRDEPGFAAKSTVQTEVKAAIAASAAALVSPGDAVALSAGTTTFEVARELADIPRLTVVTNSWPAAELLHDRGRPDCTVILTGGERTPSAALVGPVAVGSLRDLHTDWLFLGVHGLSLTNGLTTPNLAEAETDRALMAAASRVAVVADASKWDVVGLAGIAALDAVDFLITDSLPTEAEPARDLTEILIGDLS